MLISKLIKPPIIKTGVLYFNIVFYICIFFKGQVFLSASDTSSGSSGNAAGVSLHVSRAGLAVGIPQFTKISPRLALAPNSTGIATRIVCSIVNLHDSFCEFEPSGQLGTIWGGPHHRVLIGPLLVKGVMVIGTRIPNLCLIIVVGTWGHLLGRSAIGANIHI